ncbi:MAG: zinc ribbon domain-containing protein [Thermoplasmata archaeon]|nr:zinc ribbon domain-containing protein [Thermoplasmata archaeon]
MILVPVPVRRGGLRVEVAYTIAILGGALVLLETFWRFPGTSEFLLALLLGAVIVALGATASFRPRNRGPIGALIVLVGFASLLVGGGFYLGALLTIVGGIFVANTGSRSFARSPPSTFSAQALGPPCPRCGKHIPTWTAKCPYCGYPEAN